MAEKLGLKVCLWRMKMEVGSVSHSVLTPWAVAHEAPLSMGFSRQEYWSELPFPSLGDLAHPGIEPRSPGLSANSLLSELQRKSED